MAPVKENLFLFRLLLILISGLMLILSFPTYSLGGYLIWFALVPFLWVIYQETSLNRIMGYSLLLGMVFYGGTFIWLLALHPLDWMGLSIPVSALILVLGWLALSFYHSMFWVAFGVVVSRVRHSPIKRFLLPALLWPLLEIARQWGPIGFPWSNLAISQQDNLLMLQSVSLFGMEGLDFLIVLVNTALVLSLLSIMGRLQDEARLTSMAEPLRSFLQTGLAFTLAAGFALYGFAALKEIPQGEKLRVSLLQGNIPQDIKWSHGMRDYTLSIYQTLTKQALKENPDLILMPETSLPFFVTREPDKLDSFKSLLQNPSTVLVMGVPNWFTGNDGRRYLTNSAVAVASSRPELPEYDKQKLVIFGEYIPLRFLIPPVFEKLDLIGDDYSTTGKILPLDISKGKLGIAICFDSLFPEILKKETREGAQLLAVMTNDAWYKTSTGPYQHFAIARLRAVEERRYLIRAANTGISGIIDPYGRILARSELLTETVVTGEVRMMKQESLYNQYGIFFPVSLGIGLIFLLLLRPKSPRKNFSL